MQTYTVAKMPPGFAEQRAWDEVAALQLDHFRPEGSDHRPLTQVRLLYSRDGIAGVFRVEDRFVRSVHTRYGDPVCLDSCVEFFVQPRRDGGYFNFEFNCGGAMLCCYILDLKRNTDEPKESRALHAKDAAGVRVRSSMPAVVEPEIVDPVEWSLEFFIPFRLLEKYAGGLGDPAGQTWRANFYKCGDETSHPHWASWRPVPEVNFHLPEYFGELRFG